MKKIFLFLVALLTVPSVKAAFSANVVNYGDALKVGVFADQIDVMYDKDIYFNKRQYAKLLSIVDHPSLPSVSLDSYLYKGFDQKVIKTMIALNADFTTATVAGAEVTLTLVQDDKYNVTVNQILRFAYTPDADFTNEVYVTDRLETTDRVTLKVKPKDATKKIGKSTGYTGYNTNFPAINCLGSFFDDYSESVKPADTNPELIYNYVQFQKTGYRYGLLASKQNLYTKGTIKAQKDAMAKNLHLKLMEKTMLFGGTAYRSGITLPTQVNEYQTMWGLEDWILTNGTANKGYTSTISSGLIDDFDTWLWMMADPDLDDPAKKRLTLCNQAAIKWLTDLKTSKPGIELAPNDTWGIPGIKTVQWGNMELDLMVESAVNEKYSSQTKPYFMALTPPMIKVAKMLPTTLAANIQNNNVTGFESEYRTAWTFLLHNSATAYHGIFYDAS